MNETSAEAVRQCFMEDVTSYMNGETKGRFGITYGVYRSKTEHTQSLGFMYLITYIEASFY